MRHQTLAPESPNIRAAEARAASPALVSSIQDMAHSRLLTVGIQTPVIQVAALLASAQISVVVVCDAYGVPLGSITETDLVRRLGLGHANFVTTLAGDVMGNSFTTCKPSDLLSEVLATMHMLGLIHVLLVDDSNKLLGVVNARDGLRALLAAGNQEEALLRNYVMGVGYQ